MVQHICDTAGISVAIRCIAGSSPLNHFDLVNLNFVVGTGDSILQVGPDRTDVGICLSRLIGHS